MSLNLSMSRVHSPRFAHVVKLPKLMTEPEISAFKADLRKHEISDVEVDHFGGDTYLFDGSCAKNYRDMWEYYRSRSLSNQNTRVLMSHTVLAMPKIEMNRIRIHEQTIQAHPDLFKAVMLYEHKPLGVLWA